LRTPNSKKNEPKFWHILSPKNSFAKTSSTELALEFRQFLLWRNPTSPATTIPKKENGSRGKSKKNAWWRGEGGATERERKNTVVPDSILKWTLRRDGIRRGAYDYISHHHTLGACGVITSLCFGNRCEFGTIQTPVLLLGHCSITVAVSAAVFLYMVLTASFSVILYLYHFKSSCPRAFQKSTPPS
jgi:hypothetical protein